MFSSLNESKTGQNNHNNQQIMWHEQPQLPLNTYLDVNNQAHDTLDTLHVTNETENGTSINTDTANDAIMETPGPLPTNLDVIQPPLVATNE